MLAYLFWHWPTAGVATSEYERMQVDFHRALAGAGVSGFQGSTIFRIDGQAPWVGGSPAYADWYLLDGSSVLDPLNEAAVSGLRKGPHDVLAHSMGAGAGSLLQLRGPAADVPGARWSTWLAKPRGMPYDPFYARLGSVSALAGVSIWRRQMVLGPTLEFGLLSPDRLELPSGFESIALRIEPISA
jgi:hypothetical protein